MQINSLADTTALLPTLAQAPAPAGPSGTTMLLFYGLLLVGMYFLLIAPQRKKQKEHQKMLTELKQGDEVITAGGIYGTITNVKEDTFTVRLGEGVKVEVGKSYILSKVPERAGK